MTNMEDRRKLEVAIQLRQLAEINYQNKKLSDAFFYYINCLKVFPEWKQELKSRFFLVLSCLGQMLEKKQEFSEIFTIYEEALKLYTDSAVVHHNLGAHLLRLGYPEKAALYFKEALKCNENYLPAYRSLHSTHCALVERWHYRMLNDSYRNKCYRDAIVKKISRGFDTVLDIGTGTGLFCLYALEGGTGGARKIYGCDYNSVMTSIASKVIADNFVDNRILILNVHSNDLIIPENLPERVSLVVTETMDSCMLGEHMLQTLKYAWEHLLYPPANASHQCSSESKRVGVVIPSSGSLWFAAVQSKLLSKRYVFPLSGTDAVECANALANITLKNDVPHNFQRLNLQNIKLFVNLNEPYDTERLQLLPDCRFLTEARQIFYINFNHPKEIEECLTTDTECRLEITSTSEGYFHALAAWFRVHLDEYNSLSSAMDDANASNCCWDQAIFPNKQVYHVYPGSRINIVGNLYEGRVTLNVQQVIHPHASVVNSHCPVSSASAKIISILNDKILLENLESAALEFVQKVCPEGNVRIIDLFAIPIFGLTLLRNVHLLNRSVKTVKLVCCANNLDDSEIIKSIAKNSGLPISCILVLLENMLDDHLIRYVGKKYFDAVMIDPLNSEGDLNEDIINRISMLRSLLKPNGVMLPKKIEVCGQLIYSDYIEKNMRIINDEVNCCGIGPALNEFQVSQMVEIDLSSLKYEQYSSSFVCHEFDMQSLNSEFSKEFLENVVRQGALNSVLYWYNICYSKDDNRYYCTSDEFSYVHQAAFLCKHSITFQKNQRAIVQFMYHYGTFIMNIKN